MKWFSVALPCLILMLPCLLLAREDHPITTTHNPTSTEVRPYLKVAPYNTTVTVEEEFTLPCEVGGTAPFKVVWFHFYERLRRKGTYFRIRNSGSLHFKRIILQHSGYYSCVINSTYGIIHSPLVYLKVDAPAVIVQGPTDRYVKEGDTVFLTCEVFGDPMPTITWKVDGQPIIDPVTRILYNKPQYIFNATKTQEYECLAENRIHKGFRQARKSAIVRVREKPRGYCKPYKGRICQKYIGHRLMWQNFSAAINESEEQELHLLQLWKQLISSTSSICRPTAEALLCELAFPACSNTTDGDLLHHLCREQCEVIEKQFCLHEWPSIRRIAAEQNISLPQCPGLPQVSRHKPWPGRLDQPATCSTISLFDGLPSHKSKDFNHSCYHGDGRLYAGAVNRTTDALPCQSWAVHMPHPHPYITPQAFPILAGATNQCRNPGGLKARPWCYVNLVEAAVPEWQYCDIPQCASHGPDLYGEDEEFFTAETIVIILVVSLVSVSLVVLMVLFCYRLRQNRSGYKQAQCEITDEDMDKLPSNDLYHQQSQDTIINTLLEQAEYPRNDLMFVRDIGQGAFGPVFKAKAPNIVPDQDWTVVVVKMLREDASEEMQSNFESEASLLLELDHPNIIRLFGVCAIGKPMCLLFEYMSHGDLNEFLRNCSPDHFIARNRSTELLADRPKLDCLQLLSICRQIAAAMVYLGDRGFVHRDLATRNCLVGQDHQVKISDFSLARRVQEDSGDQYIGSDQDALPIRWMPLESILYNQFSPETDVWSFGVVVWEVYSFGLQPYSGMEYKEVVKYIRDGNVLICPENAPLEMYELMQLCWRLSPQERPSFEQIHRQICYLEEEVAGSAV